MVKTTDTLTERTKLNYTNSHEQERITIYEGDKKYAIIDYCDSTTVKYNTSGEEAIERANVICKAVNNYDALLSALKCAKDIMTTYYLMKSKAGYEIEEAIKKATA